MSERTDDTQVDRMIVRDMRGRLVSVRADNIPKGATIIGKDKQPGVSEFTADVFTSDVKNPPKDDTVKTEDDLIAELKAAQDEADSGEEPEPEPKKKK